MEGKRAVITDFIYKKPGVDVSPGVCLYPQPGSSTRYRAGDTVVQALTHGVLPEGGRGGESLGFRIPWSKSLAYLRRNKRFILVEDLPEDLVEDEDIGQKLDVYRAVSRLDPKLRTVVMLRFYEDMKLEEIARITGHQSEHRPSVYGARLREIWAARCS